MRAQWVAALAAAACVHRASPVSEALACPQDEIHQGKTETEQVNAEDRALRAAAAIGFGRSPEEIVDSIEPKTFGVFHGCGRTAVCEEGGAQGWQKCEVRAWAPNQARVETPDVERREPGPVMRQQSRAAVQCAEAKVVGAGDERNWNLRGCGHHWECRMLSPTQFACRSTDVDEEWSEFTLAP